MKAKLATMARSLGFDLCQVAPAVVPPHAGEFREWLSEGRAGEMAWLGRDPARRTDLQLVLPGVQSLIVLGLNYYNSSPLGDAVPAPDAASPNRKSQIANRKCQGRIARYAWGDDYHDTIEQKLKALDQWLIEQGGRQRYYVDTGPILERDYAALAGAGWQGKSTMLIHPKLGTWLFLAEILTTLKFEPDAPMADHCGKCTRCIDACPTSAITSAHRLDARRCLSYLTIENKGAIPVEFRAALGDRIYGCDECLDVCPWNRFAQASQESTFAARNYVHGWALPDFLALDDDSFRKLFARSPIKRIKRRGFLRNVCVALGNVGTTADLPALQQAAQDPEPLIAEHAQWAMEEIGRRAEVPPGKAPDAVASES